MTNEERPYWTFKQYPLDEKKGVVDKWRKKCRQYDPFAELEFETALNHLAALKNKMLWQDPDYRRHEQSDEKRLKTQPYKQMTSWEDIGEIRFTNAAKTPLRVFGFHRDEEQEFVMLGAAVEDNRKYDPTNIREICIGNKKDITLDREKPMDFDFSNEEEDDDDDEYLRALLGLD